MRSYGDFGILVGPIAIGSYGDFDGADGDRAEVRDLIFGNSDGDNATVYWSDFYSENLTVA